MKRTLFINSLTGIFSVLFLCYTHKSEAAVIYVNQAAVGTNNGTSWANAYTSLSDALQSAAFGDEIWVALGVYKPDVNVDLNGSGGIDSREVVFEIPDGVSIYGGFDGLEMLLEERDWETNQTILSGDIDNNDINLDGNNISESTSDIVGDNAYHVVYTNNVGTQTLVDGFIITSGSANIDTPVDPYDPNLDGGGWYNQLSAPEYESSPTIVNVSFYGNFASSEGGGMYNLPGPAGAVNETTIDGCLFSNNKADITAGGLYLGSFDPGNYSPVIINCLFEANEAYRRGGAIYFVGDHAQVDSSSFENNLVTAISEDFTTLPGSGGAVALVSSNAGFNSCYFLNNSATGNPTGAYEGGGGGAVYISANDPQTSSLGASVPTFISCGFYSNYAGGNTSAWGGAVVHLNDGGILQPKYVNCVFDYNTAINHGGAIATFTRVLGDPDGFVPAIEPEYTNCTFNANTAGQLGGAIYNDGYPYMGSEILNSVIENTIIWNNTAGTDGNQIYNNSNVLISYSDIEGSGGSGAGWDISIGTDGGNNIDDDPDFVNMLNSLGGDNIPATSDDGLRLTMSSPAINVGNNAAAGLAGITTDYIGITRVAHSQVEMGAYERTGIILPEFDITWLFEWPNWEPPCYTCPPPWALLLFDRYTRIPQYLWKDKAQLIIEEDKAEIIGELYNYKNPDISFMVHLKLENKLNWEKWHQNGGSYFTITPEAAKISRVEHVNWNFWELSDESYLQGTGNVQGKLMIKKLPYIKSYGFQLGKGANAWDADYGMAGYFAYRGKLKYKRHKLRVYGVGSINVDGEPCVDDCIPLIDLKNGQTETDIEFDVTDNSELNIEVYPQPVNDVIYIRGFDVDFEDQLIIKIYDLNGRIIFSDEYSASNNNISIPVFDLKAGVYTLHILSRSSGLSVTKLIIKN